MAITVLARAECPVCGWTHDFGLRVVTRALVCEGEETQLQAQVETDEVIPGHVCTVTDPAAVAPEPRFVEDEPASSPRCSAHGLTLAEHLALIAQGEPADCTYVSARCECSMYADTGMHWDTCPGRGRFARES